MKNNYRVFAFSEDVINIYNKSYKAPELNKNKYPIFDTILLFIHQDSVLETKFLSNGKIISSDSFDYSFYPTFHFPIELAGTIKPEQKEQPLFCVGDRVFDWHCEWMTITEIKSHGSIFTICDKKQKPHNFFGEHLKRLSFTEYNFITGGWSQERPPEVGSWGWFWSDEYDLVSEEVVYGKLQKVEDGVYYTNENQYNHFSTKTPFEK